MKPQTGDVVFVRGKGTIPSLIRFFDKGRFNHVAVFISETDIIEAEYDTNVRITKFKYTDYEIVYMNLTDAEKSTLLSVAHQFVGERYDLPEIFRLWVKIVFNWGGLDKFNNAREVVCSELTADLLESVGKVKKGMENITPNELYILLTGKHS